MITSPGGMSANSSVRRVLWMLGFAFVLHEAEEWHLVSWCGAHFEPGPAFTDREARTLLVLFALLGFGLTVVSMRLLSLRRALLVLLPFFVAILLGNALTHVFWLFYFRAYAPGVVTSALLIVPLALYLVREVLARRLVPAAYVWFLLALALVQPAGAAWAGATLSGPQLALQHLGARLAGWLWGTTG